MPLYMDLHKASDYDTPPTVEEIKKNHIADLAVQHQYGVRFVQYWINEEAGLVFCLMEAPNQEACVAVHAQAHGAMPCNVIELQGGDYKVFHNDGTRKNEYDLVEHSDGTLDSGYRTLLVVDLLAFDKELIEEICETITRHGGHLLQRPSHRHTAVFTTTAGATICAEGILQSMIERDQPGTEIRIGISVGAPVNDGPHLFADALQLANRLCDVAHHGEVVLSAAASRLAVPNTWPQSSQAFKTLTPENELFLHSLIEATASLAAENNLHIDGLIKALGTSRSQLYRNVKGLTGLSPNRFIQEWRLQKAFQMIRDHFGNITQIALEAGFGNLSYFAKTFQQRFGLPPLKIAQLHAH